MHRDIFGLLDGIIFFGQDILRAKALLPSPVLHCRTREELDNALDFFYPLVADVVPDLCSASWIYDFQHVYLPEFFPRGEIQSRNIKFRRVAESAKLVVLSSKNAEQDFRRIFPDQKLPRGYCRFTPCLQTNGLRRSFGDTAKIFPARQIPASAAINSGYIKTTGFCSRRWQRSSSPLPAHALVCTGCN